MNKEQMITELNGYLMEKYFEMIDQKLKLDRQIDILHDAYMKIWYGESIRKINANLKWNDILRHRRSELIDKMAKMRADIPKDILKEWKKEYGKRIASEFQ